MTERLLTLNEVSELYRAPPATLRYWRHTGYGPASFRLGRRIVYRESDVLAWLREQHDATKSGAK